MIRNSFTCGVVLAALAMLGTVGAAAAQPGFPATSFLAPAKAMATGAWGYGPRRPRRWGKEGEEHPWA